MPLARTAGNPDRAGRLRIVGFHFQPHRLTLDARKQFVEVSELDAEGPSIEPHQRKLPWLLPDGNVEWDVHQRDADDPVIVAKRLAAAEARIAAMLQVAENKDLLAREEVDADVDRTSTDSSLPR